MKHSNLKIKKDGKKIIKPKGKLAIQEEPGNSKFRNEAFQKLCERNTSSKDRFNTIENVRQKRTIPSPRSNSNQKENRNKNSQRKVKNSQKKNHLENSATKSKKIFRAPYNGRKFKDYPNLIGGVLNQVNYYNINNNTNYNENIRYKPIDYFFNEQSSISTKKERENNNNSPNISFNSENQNQNNIPKNEKEKNLNNIHKIKVEEENDNDNANDNIYNNYNAENEIKVNPETIKSRKNGAFEKNGKTISPIISASSSKENRIKNGKNDIIGQYINNNTDKDHNTNEINNNYNENNENNNQPINEQIINNNQNVEQYNQYNDNNYYTNNNNMMHLTPSQFNVEKNEKEENKQEIPKKMDSLTIESNNNFNLYYNNINNFNDLEAISTNIIPIYNSKENNFENLDAVRYNEIIYIGEEIKNEINEKKDEENNDKKLVFNDDDEVFHYIKERIKEEKDEEYNKDGQYNNFILSKQFHGKPLYEIGLKDDINYINSVLEKENVEIQNEPVIFISKKELEQLKNGQKFENENENTENNNEEIAKLKNENEKLKKKIDLINKTYEEKNSNLINEYNKLMDEIEKLNEYNKQLENELNNKQYIINEYDKKIQEYSIVIEDYNRLQVEKEKYIKYINELQEYDEKVILEYQKVKQLLEIEKEKNLNNEKEGQNIKRYFTNDELNIILNDLFSIINNNISQKEKYNIFEIDNTNQIFIINNDEPDINKNIQNEVFQQKETINPNTFNDNLYEEYQNNIQEPKQEPIQEPEPIIYEKKVEEKNKKVNKAEIYEEKGSKKDNNDENQEKDKKKNKVTFGPKKINIKEKKGQESLSRAMQRINNKRKMDKLNEEENKFRKSKKIEGMAGNLQDKIKNNEGKFYVDLEYEKNKSEEEN